LPADQRESSETFFSPLRIEYAEDLRKGDMGRLKGGADGSWQKGLMWDQPSAIKTAGSPTGAPAAVYDVVHLATTAQRL
jgi:hypothetical protein